MQASPGTGSQERSRVGGRSSGTGPGMTGHGSNWGSWGRSHGSDSSGPREPQWLGLWATVSWGQRRVNTVGLLG